MNMKRASKDKWLRIFAIATAVALEKYYMSTDIEELVYDEEWESDEATEKALEEIWDELDLVFKEVFGCKRHEVY